jgi:transcriptional repressor AefR-like protein
MRAMTVDTLFDGGSFTLPPDSTRQMLEDRLTAFARAVLERALHPEYLDLARLVVGESGRRPELAELFRHAVAEAGGAGLRDPLMQARAQRQPPPEPALRSPVSSWTACPPTELRESLHVVAGDQVLVRPQAERWFFDGAAVRR